MTQRCVYTAVNEAELSFAEQVLEREGVPFQRTSGTAFPSIGMPQTLFVDAEDFERAQEALALLERKGPAGERPCPSCGAPVTLELDECWSCQVPMDPSEGA